MSCQPRSRVLIMYADTGSGHRSVALAIHSALRTLSTADPPGVARASHRGAAPGVAATRTTLHNPVKHHFLGTLFDLYGPVTRHAPRLFEGAYNISNSERACDLAGRVTYKLLHKHLAEVVESTQPDLIVGVHSLLMHPAQQVLHRGGYNIPLFSVVTDLASIHQSWIVPDVDLCFVPTADVRDEMINRGMMRERIRISGLPVHPDFAATPDRAQRESLRVSLGLRPDVFTVLIMGGGEGIGGLDSIAHRLADSGLPVQMIVVAGHNPGLSKRLNKQQHEWRIPYRVFGFAHNVPALMRAADVVVTKAGSVTIAESLACGLPIILSSVIEGQESGNVDFLARHKLGYQARTTDDVVEGVHRIQRLSEDEMRELRTRARRLSAPSASLKIAGQILATLGESGELPADGTRNDLMPMFA